jgi:molecular chaperone GrpE
MMAKKYKKDENEKINSEQNAHDESELPVIPEPESEIRVLYTEEDMDKVRSELEQALVKSEEYLQGWQRERAEFFNYKKRMERENSQGSQNAIGNAIRRYLDIADDLARALKNTNRPMEGDDAIWAEGIDLIYRKMLSAFEADGVKMMTMDGNFFDPNLHEAISHEDSPDHESGQIIEVVQPGYTLGDKVLRPARVRVAR